MGAGSPAVDTMTIALGVRSIGSRPINLNGSAGVSSAGTHQVCSAADDPTQHDAEDEEYHEHVAGDKHSHPFNGPHSHGGVSALVAPAEDEGRPDLASEYGRMLAWRDRLIAEGVDPADLEMPERPLSVAPRPAEDEGRLRAVRDYVFASTTIPAPDRHRLLSFLDGDVPAEDEGRLREAVVRWAKARTDWQEKIDERSRKALVDAGDALAALAATPEPRP